MNASPDNNLSKTRWFHYALIGVIGPFLLSFFIPYLRTVKKVNGSNQVVAQMDNWQSVLIDKLYLFFFTGVLFLLGVFIVRRLFEESVLIGLLLGLLITGAAYFLFLQREILQFSVLYEENGNLYGIAFLFYAWILLYRLISLYKWNLNTRSIAIVGLLMAMSIALGRVGITTPVVRITFAFLPTALIGMLFGPLVGGAAATLVDVLTFLLVGGAGSFFPGFTLSALLTGMIYGFFLHKRQVTKTRVLMAELIIAIFINLTLNTLWIYILTRNPLAVILPPRLVQNAVTIVVRFVSIWFISTNKQLQRLFAKYSTART